MKTISSRIIVAIVCLGCLPGTIVSAQEVLDGVAATVDDRIILISEVQSQVQLAAMQLNLDLSSKALADSLQGEILQQMIDDKLILINAEKDTTIKVTPREVEDAINDHIARIKRQFPSEESFLAQLTAEGLTLKELRSSYKDEVRNQLYKEAFLNKMMSGITISSGEVREFYKTYVDSLPKLPAGVHLAHILVTTSPGQATRDSLLNYTRLLYDKVKSGEDFSLLAETYSDDITAQSGGDLGWFNRGDMVPEFEEAAFALAPGEISEIVETQFGFHIIKCTDKKSNSVRASHILIKYELSDDDLRQSKQSIDSLYTLLAEGANFEEVAAKFSDDDNTVEKGGDLGWYAADELSVEFKQAVAELQPGEFSEPVRSQFGYHILKVLDKKSARPLDFEDDYNEIEAFAKRHKAQKELEQWLDGAREKYYIEVKL